MKKLLSYAKTPILLLIVTLLLGGVYAYSILRPISYGMDYECKTVYQGFEFEGRIKFDSDTTMTTFNSGYEKGAKARYYYKNGYIFLTLAQTDEDFEKEIAEINKNFKEALKTPFYSAKVSAFKLVMESPDGYDLTYTCKGAIRLAIINGIAMLLLSALTVTSFILRKKAKNKA